MPQRNLGPNFRNANIQPGQPLGALSQTVTLLADNTPVLLNSMTQMLRLGSDNATAANRTFTLTNGYIDGQLLFLHFVTGGSTSAELADTGNVKLSAAWTPVIDGTLTLQWDDLDSVWRETARSAN